MNSSRKNIFMSKLQRSYLCVTITLHYLPTTSSTTLGRILERNENIIPPTYSSGLKSKLFTRIVLKPFKIQGNMFVVKRFLIFFANYIN